MTTLADLPLWKVAYCTLYHSDSLHISHLLEQMEGLGWKRSGKTPLQTLRSELRRYSKKSKSKLVYFENLGQATWCLTSWGKENPPAGVTDMLVEKWSWIESSADLLNNQAQYVKALMSSSFPLTDILEHRDFVYDVENHHFMPLQWALCKGWVMRTAVAVQAVEILNKQLTACDLTLTQSKEPIVFTRFMQWCTEWGCSTLLEAMKLDGQEDGIRLYTRSEFKDLPMLSVSQIIEQMRSVRPQWIVDQTVVRRLHMAWEASDNRLVLLSGLTGIGKSNLVWDYAGAVLTLHGLPLERHRCMVPIQTNFRDPSALFGYVNTFANPPTFVPGFITRFLLDAHQNPRLPFYLLLDETNLSKMEHYLAPLISTFEVGAPLVFHQGVEEISGIPPQISGWPKNIWIAGTMNFEAGAHLPADKILDRAHSIELWDIDIEGWLSQQKDLPAEVHQALSTLYEILHPIRCHFGYRTLKAIGGYVKAGMSLQVPVHTLLDEAVISKVLPKIKGDRERLTADVFNRLEEWCRLNEAGLSLSRVELLKSQVQRFGMVRYWN